MLNGIRSDAVSKDLAENAAHVRLKKACDEFESIFLTYLLKSMRATVDTSGFFGESQERKMFQSMLDEKLAHKIATNKGVGLGSVLFEQLKNRIK